MADHLLTRRGWRIFTTALWLCAGPPRRDGGAATLRAELPHDRIPFDKERALRLGAPLPLCFEGAAPVPAGRRGLRCGQRLYGVGPRVTGALQLPALGVILAGTALWLLVAITVSRWSKRRGWAGRTSSTRCVRLWRGRQHGSGRPHPTRDKGTDKEGWPGAGTRGPAPRATLPWAPGRRGDVDALTRDLLGPVPAGRQLGRGGMAGRSGLTRSSRSARGGPGEPAPRWV